MARSDEHKFVTDTFIEVARELSRSALYGYGEADRGTFDFACSLTATNTRQLIGQTLTHHAEGIDKDLASLLHDSGKDLPVYLYAHDARNEGRVQEFLHRAQGRLSDRASVLRLFRYPHFDADVESERCAVASAIRSQILNDLLLNVLFGRLQALDISLFLQGTGIRGLLLATLEEIALNGFVNFTVLANALQMKPSTLRSRVQALLAAGMLAQMPGKSMFAATPRAAILLRICALLRSPSISSELAFILERLDLGGATTYDPLPAKSDEFLKLPFSPEGKRVRLLDEIHASFAFGLRLTSTHYEVVDPLASMGEWVGR
jgi:hypothetical protein